MDREGSLLGDGDGDIELLDRARVGHENGRRFNLSSKYFERRLKDRFHLPFLLQSAAPFTSSTLIDTNPGSDLLVRLALSCGLTRITKLGASEEQFEVYASGVAGIAKALESGSEAPVRKKDIVRRLGTLHGFRMRLNLEDSNLLDEPEFLWEDSDLHGTLGHSS